MKITVIGGGYVGLTTTVCLASVKTIDVICLETDSTRVEQLQNGRCPIKEPEMELLLNIGLSQNKIMFTTNPEEAISTSNLFLIAVGTPENLDGSADLNALKKASEDIGHYLTQNAVVIIKSTIPPGGTNLVYDWILSNCSPKLAVNVVYSPEFLREGSAVADFYQPERIVIGSDNTIVAQQVAELYRDCIKNNAPILFTSPRNAEIIKYASNSFLALKVTFVNELAKLCEKVGGQISIIAKGIGMDSRIGAEFLKAGPGYGGACLPKDLRGLTAFARSAGAPLPILEQVHMSNSNHQQWIADVIARTLPENALISVWGLTFKVNTDDIRNSPSISIIKTLSAYKNIHFQLYDPTVNTKYLKCLEGISHMCYDNPKDAVDGANALVIAVPWPEFRHFPQDFLISQMSDGKWVFDLCEGYDGTRITCPSLNYWGLGKGVL